MPIYDYQCTKCEKIEELSVKVSARHDKYKCSKCNNELKKLTRPPSFMGLASTPGQEHFDNFTKSELADELKEYDGYKRQEDKETEKKIRSGEFI